MISIICKYRSVYNLNELLNLLFGRLVLSAKIVLKTVKLCSQTAVLISKTMARLVTCKILSKLGNILFLLIVFKIS